MRRSLSKIQINPKLKFIEPTLLYIQGCLSFCEYTAEEQKILLAWVRNVLETLINNSSTSIWKNPIKIEYIIEKNCPYITIENKGLPIYHLPPLEVSYAVISLENNGRNGQLIRIKFPENTPIIQELKSRNTLQISAENVDIFRLEAKDTERLSELFFQVYGYLYINEDVYFPEVLARKIESGELVAMVAATKSGQLVGHVGLVRSNNNPVVYEASMGVVDSRIKSHGLFTKIFDELMKVGATIEMQYLFCDFVTNHDYSQKLVSKYGSKDLAIFIGCQSNKTQARLEKLGIGHDADEMKRYSLLYSVIPKTEYPFGEQVTLPINLGESLGFLLDAFNCSWIPASRFSTLPDNGTFKISLQQHQQAVYFDLFEPGHTALDQILESWKKLLRDGFQYAAIDVPLDYPGLAVLYDRLAIEGFFIAGFIPFHLTGKLGFRFQSLGPTEVAFDQIKVSTTNGKKLLNLIRQDYERNSLL